MHTHTHHHMHSQVNDNRLWICVGTVQLGQRAATLGQVFQMLLRACRVSG